MSTVKSECPICEKEVTYEEILTKEDYEVRGELITVDVRYEKCSGCGAMFENLTHTEDPRDKAYREYRRRYVMLQPEEIRSIREKYGLTQKELSTLLGFGGATLSRYENGALQDEVHDDVLRNAEEPRYLLNLIERKPEALRRERRSHLIQTLKDYKSDRFSFDAFFDEFFADYEPTELSGFKYLDLLKLYPAILYFCKDGIFKTVLNKLLFYADFKHFRDYAISITGARYAHSPFGPVLDHYELIFSALIKEGMLEPNEIFYPSGDIGEVLIPTTKPDLSVFGPSELKVLASVKEFFEGYKAIEISKFSHEEEGYKETDNGELISYHYGDFIKIPR